MHRVGKREEGGGGGWSTGQQVLERIENVVKLVLIRQRSLSPRLRLLLPIPCPRRSEPNETMQWFIERIIADIRFKVISNHEHSRSGILIRCGCRQPRNAHDVRKSVNDVLRVSPANRHPVKSASKSNRNCSKRSSLNYFLCELAERK